MKRNILSVLLLPLFLTSCFLFDGGEKDNDNKQTENTQEEKNTQQTETYSLVYDGPTTVILNYGDSYQLSTAKLEGTNKDPNTTYSIRSNTYKNAARVTETGLVTAMEYDRSLSENINEDVKVTLSSEYASNSIIVRFVICHFQENVSFDTIMNGENYYFYTSTGIVENLKCNWNDSQETEPWYAECTLYEEDTGKYFNTTISKSFNYLTLDDNLVTSHYKTVIKRDEKGSTTAKDIKNGSKIKFLTMLRYNEEFGFTNGFNTIMLEEISVPDTLCTIENLNPYLSVDKTSGRYDEEFIVTRTENRFVFVMGEHCEIYAERYLDETQNVGIYKFKSKHIKIYSDENVPETETLYGQFPNGSNAGNAAFDNNKTYLHNYLFNNESLINITRFRNIYERPNGINVGNGDTTCPYLVVNLAAELRITRIECTVASLTSSRPSRVQFETNFGSIKQLLLEKSSGSQTFSSYTSLMPITEFTFYCYPRETVEHIDTTGFSITNLKLYSRDAVVNIGG